MKKARNNKKLYLSTIAHNLGLFSKIIIFVLVFGLIIINEIDGGKKNTIGFYWHYHVNRSNKAHIWYLF